MTLKKMILSLVCLFSLTSCNDLNKPSDEGTSTEVKEEKKETEEKKEENKETEEKKNNEEEKKSASEEKNKFTVKWYNGSTLIKEDKDIDKGSSITYNGETPIKEASAQYTYTFIGWNTNENANSTIEIGPITKDEKYYAIYKQEIRKYEVKFLGYRERELDIQQIEYNNKPSTDNLNKLDINDAFDYYTFLGWSLTKGSSIVQYTNSTLPAITKDTNFYAIYDIKEKKYDVTIYLNELGTTNIKKQYRYNDQINPSDFPTDVKLTKEYKYISVLELYEFVGWHIAYNGDALTTDDMLCKTNKVNTYNLLNINEAYCFTNCNIYPIFEPISVGEKGGASYKESNDSEYTTFSWSKFVSNGYVSVTNNIVKGNKTKLSTLNDLYIEIPDGITGLADDAFNGVSNLQSIYFLKNNTLNLIGERAFKDCVNDLFHYPVIFNSSVEIKAEAFSGLKITDMVFDSKVIRLHTNAFKGLISPENYYRRTSIAFRVGNYTSDEYEGDIFNNNWHGGSYLVISLTLNGSFIRDRMINN